MSSRFIGQEIDYVKPTSLKEASELAVKYGKDAEFHAGGTTVVLLLKLRGMKANHLIDISDLPDLDYITLGKTIRVGALTPLHTVEINPTVSSVFPSLIEAIKATATMQIRNMCRVGGNLAAYKYGARFGSVDIAAPLMALGAEVKVYDSKGGRTMTTRALFMDPKEKFLPPGEIITELEIPTPPEYTDSAYMRIGISSEDRIPSVNVAVKLTVRGDTCEDISLYSSAPRASQCAKAEAFLKGKTLDEKNIREAALTATEELKFFRDIRSDAPYKKEVFRVITERSIKKAVERAKAKATK